MSLYSAYLTIDLYTFQGFDTGEDSQSCDILGYDTK